MTEVIHPRTVLQVDLAKITANLKAIEKMVDPCQVMAVLKANAYGLGLPPVARCLVEAGVSRIGVADLNEALRISSIGKPVQILGSILPKEIAPAVAAGVVLPVADLATASEISRAAGGQGKKSKVHFVIDTGMGRLGVPLARAEDVIRQVLQLPHLEFEGICSHFPNAYADPEFSRRQIHGLQNLLARLPVKFDLVHIANSDGINNLPEACQAPFNMVRSGINLYGYFDLLGQKRLNLQPVIKLTSRLVAVRSMPQGSSVGYGREYVLPEDDLVGTVAIGYADGFPMRLCHGGQLLIGGRKCPVIGRVSMDYTTVSLKNVPNAKVGDEVVCLGDGLSLDDWVSAKGTITYEAICALGQRVHREYIGR